MEPVGDGGQEGRNGDAVVLVAEAWSRRYGVNSKLDSTGPVKCVNWVVERRCIARRERPGVPFSFLFLRFFPPHSILFYQISSRAVFFLPGACGLKASRCSPRVAQTKWRMDGWGFCPFGSCAGGFWGEDAREGGWVVGRRLRINDLLC